MLIEPNHVMRIARVSNGSQMKTIGKPITPDKLAEELWFDIMEDYKFMTNLNWLKNVFRSLKVGGIWGYSEHLRFFKKVDDTHFIEVTHDEA